MTNESTKQRINYVLHLADNSLILAQRSSEWCGHGPVLEQDIAITNISLDLLGQARNLYQYAAQLINQSGQPSLEKMATEDSLAYLRAEREFKNCLLVELPNGDWGQTTLRQFFFSTYQFYLFNALQRGRDTQLAAIAEKALKETSYHLRWSSEWVIRLGDGTPESHQRMLNALHELWPYTGEFFEWTGYEKGFWQENNGADASLLQQEWMSKVTEIFHDATLSIPEKVFMQTGGKNGLHTEHMGYILTDLQYLQRAYPGAQW